MSKTTLTRFGSVKSTENRPALEQLCAKVGYLGDTASLAQMWVEDSPPLAITPPLDGCGGSHRRAASLRARNIAVAAGASSSASV